MDKNQLFRFYEVQHFLVFHISEQAQKVIISMAVFKHNDVSKNPGDLGYYYGTF